MGIDSHLSRICLISMQTEKLLNSFIGSQSKGQRGAKNGDKVDKNVDKKLIEKLIEKFDKKLIKYRSGP